MTSLESKPDPATTDPNIPERLTEAISLLHSGEREQARQEFHTIWRQLETSPDPHRACILAHFMADAQDRPEDELHWDIIALDAASRALTAAATRQASDPDVAMFLPSLHLNLGDDYLRLGDTTSAFTHLRLALRATESLPDTPYGSTIKGGIARLAERLEISASSLIASKVAHRNISK